MSGLFQSLETGGFLPAFASRLEPQERLALGQILPRAIVSTLYREQGLEFAVADVSPAQKEAARNIYRALEIQQAMISHDHIYMIMKSTRLCNLRCAYCNSWRSGPGQKMSFDVLARATIGALNIQSVRQVDFVWHGGEATLLPVSFYERALWLQRHYNRYGVAIQNSIQTNAVHLSEEWVRFLAIHKFGVGISVDGPPDLHDSGRMDIRGRPTSQRISETVSRLRAAGVKIGFLLVVTPRTIELGAERLLEWLADTGVPNLSVLNSIPDNTSEGSCPDHYLSFDDYVSFLVELAEVWHGKHRHTILIREIDSLINNLRGSPSVLCVHKGRCMGQFLTVDPDGMVSACDKYIGDGDYVFGDVAQRSVAEIASQSASVLTAAANSDHRSDQYELNCEYGAVCRGGCPHDAYLLEHFGIGRGRQCCGLAPLIRRLRALGHGSPESMSKGGSNYGTANRSH